MYEMLVLVPFKVKPLPLEQTEDYHTEAEYGRKNCTALVSSRVLEKVWTVVGYRPMCYNFVKRSCIDDHYMDIPFPDVLLLVREGEMPTWWPRESCEVVDENR